ncbi:hypothetical protein [Natronobacterium gregoryi]|uniref:Uncharacterized protein n=2 Tax=Natronobacterium gregoryi TaxID=44930 RepID=L0AKD7_NATGS|nr:hypothetical protein [Natronobacterium gregoryi]AFZ73520.1 hypothetical protein Natgr_2348 [Natronobacterium gregoryi SP2]ELY68376.1 hypothetical protein C490_09888 [Natronobacterium gregoryi SP2]PLK20577.1 hypothetical protein CYV19_09040 [Natronobacterium gregoryi SP2]SFJ16791.1 hypothetical protein SAMN05443661_11623 [Natronobacterium gregoryi]
MPEPLRSSVGNAVAEFSRSLAAVVGLVWLCFVVSVVTIRILEATTHNVSVSSEPLWIGILVVAVVAAGVLSEDGYERLGVDPSAGWTFAWLAIFFLPFAFAPLRVAVALLATNVALFDALFVFGATLSAGWLAFYDGLERIGLEPVDFARVIPYAVALGIGPIAVFLLFDHPWLTEGVGVAVATVVQVGACWFALSSQIP